MSPKGSGRVWGLAQPSSQSALDSFVESTKRPGCEGDQSPSFSADVEKDGAKFITGSTLFFLTRLEITGKCLSAEQWPGDSNPVLRPPYMTRRQGRHNQG